MSDNPMASGWFHMKPGPPAGTQAGPVSWEQLWALAQSGELAPEDVVWHQTLPGWMPAAHIPSLFPGLPAATAPTGSVSGRGAPTAAAHPPGRRRSSLVWVIPLVAFMAVGVGLGLYFGLRGGDSGSGPVGLTAGTPVVAGEPGTWLIMLYSDADDEILEEDMAFDLNEAELVGSTDGVTVVAQMDRYVGGYAGDGDVTSTKRYLLTQDADLYTVNSEELADLGEVDMGDGRSLVEFGTWAIGSYPAEHYVLILSDHGGGWTGGWTDNDPELGSGLAMQEIDDALGAIIAQTGIGAFELVGFDACLMGQLEVMSAITPHAAYAVGSEQTEPLLGWSYAGFLQALNDDPTMTGRELGQAIVDGYVGQDARVIDDQARSVLTGGDYTAESVATVFRRDTTLAAVDLRMMQDLNAAVNDLAVALTGVDQELVAQARAYAQAYASVFGEDNPPSYIDLGHFVDLLLESAADPSLTQAAQQVKSILAQTVTAEVHGEAVPGSSGLTIYFPNSTEYVGAYGEWLINYPSSIGRFAAASLWDDYLTFHYTGETFDPGAADLSVLTPAGAGQTDFAQAVEDSAPSKQAEIVAPGAGQLAIAPISVSAGEVRPDESVTLSTEITGTNIAYVYYYVAYYWENDGSFLSADAGFVEPGYVKEISGVYYPDWGDEGVVPAAYVWAPTMFFMSDGNPANDQFAFFQPSVYGAEVSGDIYTVSGTYTFVDSGTQMDAEINFSGDGSMLSVWGFSGAGDGSSAGTWHEITPRPGDTFTISDEYLEFTANPDGEFVAYNGGVMTFGNTPFTMVRYPAAAGSYLLGIGVEDLDGNLAWEFAEVTVTE